MDTEKIQGLIALMHGKKIHVYQNGIDHIGVVEAIQITSGKSHQGNFVFTVSVKKESEASGAIRNVQEFKKDFIIPLESFEGINPSVFPDTGLEISFFESKEAPVTIVTIKY